MITQVTTVAEFNALPSYIRNAIQNPGTHPSGHRFTANIAKAERKQMLHAAAARGVREGEISLPLAVEILVTNNAYGPKGKAALREFA